jgi:nitroimidazol reductase NimA-like FMN-containing flavoprotein (pyridoxamine 5'-phosphate oxidase superfamily)
MLDKMKALARKENMCVLATDAGGKPHCSLMAYVPDDACEEIYMVTRRDTQKYRNLMKNPSVSMLIDSRKTDTRPEIQALTVSGALQKINIPAKRNLARAKLLEAHPHLSEFIHHAAAEILCVKISAFLLLNGLNESHYRQV